MYIYSLHPPTYLSHHNFLNFTIAAIYKPRSSTSCNILKICFQKLVTYVLTLKEIRKENRDKYKYDYKY